MDVVVIFNGLGNQMSQYAFYLQKKKYGPATQYINFCRVHNGAELERVFNIKQKHNAVQNVLYALFRLLLSRKIPLRTLIKLFFKVFNIRITDENFDYNFKENYLKSSSGINFYYGGWPSENYFNSVSNCVKQAFKFTVPQDYENAAHIASINNSNSVAMHVRRGDYLNEENINNFGKVCTLGYFEKAIATINSSVINPHFFIFSNDVEWVKNNLKMESVTYVTCNSGNNSWKDMYLMSICKHNIISNSTFSWWGAWLNNHDSKMIISPSRYLNNDIKTDFYPESWIKLSDY
jgi:hypothetical protein